MNHNTDVAPARTGRLEQPTATDCGERERIYIHAHGFGTVRHTQGDFLVDDGWVRELQEGFAKLTSEGYYPPVLRTHEPDEEDDREPRPVEDGFVFGRIFDVVSSRDARAKELTDTTGETLTATEGVWYGLEVPLWVKTAIEEGFIDNWSPSFYEGWEPPHPELGERIDLAPRHMAFVSIPHQKNTKQSSPHYALSEGLVYLQESDMADDSQDDQPVDNDESTDNQEGEALQEILTMLGDIKEMLAGKKDEDDGGDGDGEETDNADDEDREMGEVRELREANRSLRAEVIRRDLRDAGITDEDELDRLVDLSEDPQRFATAVAQAKPQPSGDTTRQEERGAKGDAPVKLSEERKREKVKRELTEQGYKPGSAEFVAEVNKRTGT